MSFEHDQNSRSLLRLGHVGFVLYLHDMYRTCCNFTLLRARAENWRQKLRSSVRMVRHLLGCEDALT